MTAGGVKRIARCGCGALTATVAADPLAVYGCSCADCQRKSGSAFSYAAMFPSEAVTIAGERKTWRRNGDSGRWIDSIFCPSCGISVGFHSEGMPGLTGIPVGTFSDPDFLPPARLYWASRRHRWLPLHADITLLDTQDG
jgi:hypothetical protein